MCLTISHNYELETAQLDFDSETKTRKCYKLFIRQQHEDTYLFSPFVEKKAILNKPYVSNRMEIRLKGFELPGYYSSNTLAELYLGELFHGIHVFLTAEDAFKAFDYAQGFLYKNESWARMVVVECECHQDNLVAVGKNTCWNYTCKGAVFTKVVPTRIIEKEDK